MGYPLLNAFWTMCLVFLWIMWLVLLFRIIGDILRSEDMGGGAKAAWLLLVLLLPFIGVLVYVLARGRGMGAREALRAQRRDEEFRAYVRDAVATGADGGGQNKADQLAKLAALKDHGDLSEDEYRRAKEKVVA